MRICAFQPLKGFKLLCASRETVSSFCRRELNEVVGGSSFSKIDGARIFGNTAREKNTFDPGK
jgi:hypothetical protein